MSLCISRAFPIIRPLYRHKMELLEFHSIIEKSMSMQRCLPIVCFQCCDFLLPSNLLCIFPIQFANNGFYRDDG